MEMQERVTINDLARRLRLDKSTVSRALNGNPMVAARTRERVRLMAERLGYHPSPVLSHIATLRNHRAEPRDAAPFAYIFCPTDYRARIDRGRFDRHFAGAEQRAHARGYKLQLFNLVDYGSCEHLSRVLKARGIKGVIVGPVRHKHPPFALDWDAFSVVSCGADYYSPPVHKVLVLGSVRLAWQQAFRQGYRRIGICAWLHEQGSIHDAVRIGDFSALSLYWKGVVEPVPLLLDHDSDSFLAWYERHRPDVVIGLVPLCAKWLQSKGIRIPEDTAFISLLSAPKNSGLACCDDRNAEVGTFAFDLCEQMVCSNARGLPRHRQVISVRPGWNPGASLPAVGLTGDSVIPTESISDTELQLVAS